MDYNNNTNNQFNQNNQNNQFNQYNQYNQTPQYYQNPQFAQNPQMNQGYPNGQYMDPMYQQQLEKEKRDNKTANMLCIASVICMLLGMVSFPAFSDIELPYSIQRIVPGFITDLLDSMEGVISSFAVMVGGVGNIAGFVLMIIARIKYPKNTFAKVLMWLYIIGIIIYLVLIILAIVACVYIMHQCAGL